MEEFVEEKFGFAEEEVEERLSEMMFASLSETDEERSVYGIAISSEDVSMSRKSDEKFKESPLSTFPRLYCEDNELFEFLPLPYEGEVEEEFSSETTESSETLNEPSITQEHGKQNIFSHSSPMHFPDIYKVKKSAFGSIFLRSAARGTEEINLLKTLAESNYNMLESLLESLDKLLVDAAPMKERKQIILSYKEAVLKALERHGISRKFSDGSELWDIYPVTKAYLFSVQIGDRLHQTRALSKIEDRLVNGLIQTLKDPFYFATGSIWSGHWDNLGMAGSGTYVMPHGVIYSGNMVDGMFHDDNATLTYPNNFKALHCVYNKGKLISCDFQFPDGLDHQKENWTYCQMPDRRFCSEIRNGLKPAKIAQKTEIDPPRKIPPGCYDTNDGFYNPKTWMLVSPSGELLRVPLCEEDVWIKKYCRKGFPQPADFRPDLFENWFDKKTIDEVLNAQGLYRKGKITYDELQQCYANCDILPSWSKYKKIKSGSQTEIEQSMKAIPEPKLLKPPKKVKKFEGHKFPQEVLKAFTESLSEIEKVDSWIGSQRKSKGSLKVHKSPKDRNSIGRASLQTSRGQSSRASTGIQTPKSSVHSTDSSVELQTRKIPECFLRPTPIIRPPFQMPIKQKKICEKKVSSESVSEPNMEDLVMYKWMKKIIMDIVNKILIQERERHRKRFLWARPLPQVYRKKNAPSERVVRGLQILYNSIPPKEEYCDSDPKKIQDLKKLAEDKYEMLKYWGKKLYVLEFDDHKHTNR